LGAYTPAVLSNLSSSKTSSRCGGLSDDEIYNNKSLSIKKRGIFNKARAGALNSDELYS
jgi:hypothetical protein